MLAWIGNVFIVIGLWGVGNKSRNAFIPSIIGEAAWITHAYLRSDWALAAICVVFCAMAVRSYIKWGQE